jgi:hypothetical protein
MAELTESCYASMQPDVDRAVAKLLREGVAVLAEEKDLYRRFLQAIARCRLTGVDFGDYVQAVCESALAGEWAECWNCGTAVHDGPCVGEGDAA